MTRPRLLTQEEIAEILGLHIQTIRKRTRAGEFPFAINVGTPRRPRWKYEPRGLEKWLEAKTSTAA